MPATLYVYYSVDVTGKMQPLPLKRATWTHRILEGRQGYILDSRDLKVVSQSLCQKFSGAFVECFILVTVIAERGGVKVCTVDDRSRGTTSEKKFLFFDANDLSYF